MSRVLQTTAPPTAQTTPAFTPVQTGLLQRKCACGGGLGVTEECEDCSARKLVLARATQELSSARRSANSVNQNSELANRNAGGIPPTVHEVLRSSGEPLDDKSREFMEQRFGHDFSKVRVHADVAAKQSAQAISARAYTVGRDIVSGVGRLTTDTVQGRNLLAHELTHVIQQGETEHATDNLTLTEPGDVAEQEADRAANEIANGNFQPRIIAPNTVARQMDAGVADAGVPPMDAGADAPRDAAPIAGVPVRVPPPAPRTPVPQPPPPSATIGAVAFRGSNHRIAPTRSTNVAVTLNNVPAGGSVTIDVEGSGGANGSASVTAGATLTNSGTATIRGDTQTSPGNARNLRVRAMLAAGGLLGTSPGFTVAAYPITYNSVYSSDINDGTLLGMVVRDDWASDGSGAMSELDEVDISERVDMQSRDNPPFTVPGATSASHGTSGYIDGDSPTTDTFQTGKSSIDTSTLGYGVWNRVQGQLSLFQCARTGVADVVMPDSGYRIIQRVYNRSPAPGFRHRTIHEPAAITVEGRRATAGSGTAESPEHVL